MTKVEPPGHVKCISPTIFEFSILEIIEIPEGFFIQTFMLFLVAEISSHITLKHTLS